MWYTRFLYRTPTWLFATFLKNIYYTLELQVGTVFPVTVNTSFNYQFMFFFISWDTWGKHNQTTLKNLNSNELQYFICVVIPRKFFAFWYLWLWSDRKYLHITYLITHVLTFLQIPWFVNITSFVTITRRVQLHK